jgi:hypothetical protein
VTDPLDPLAVAQDERERLEAIAEARDLTTDEVKRLQKVLRYLVEHKDELGDQSISDLV